MRVAVIGSRGLSVPDLERYLPAGVTQIVSGGARGVDQSARAYAQARGIPLTEFFPDYVAHGRRAPLVRNLEIIRNSNLVLAFWDGVSHGTAHVIGQCKRLGVPVKIYQRHPGRNACYFLQSEQSIDPLRKGGCGEMDEKLMSAISEFVTRRINDLGADAPGAVTDAVSDVEEQRERLSAVLSEEQQPFLRDLENALMLQSGEETRYYYRAGFYDAVKFLLEWSGAD